MVQSSCGLNVGDPVQLIRNPRRVGRVIAFTTPMSSASETWSMPYVRFPGSRIAQPYDAASLRVCKCATRIPKGVSKC